MIHPESNLLMSKYTRNENRDDDPLSSTVQQTGNYMLRVPISLSPPSKRRLTGDSDASDGYRAEPDDVDLGTHDPHQHADGLSSHFCKGKHLILFVSKTVNCSADGSSSPDSSTWAMVALGGGLAVGVRGHEFKEVHGTVPSM